MAARSSGAAQRPRVAVIGAGASGLTAVKACLEEDLHVVCYERSDVLGGLWHYSDKVEVGRGSVMRSTVINSSKEMTAFSDFPPAAHLPNYMHNTLLAGYIEQYGRQSGAAERVLLRHEVTRVQPGPDGKWTLHARNLDTDEDVTEEQLDGVMLCTGHHCYPLRPKFPGLDDAFKGRVMHSHEYRTPRGFEDRRVLIVGVGNSAGDLAVELSGVAEQVSAPPSDVPVSRSRSLTASKPVLQPARGKDGRNRGSARAVRRALGPLSADGRVIRELGRSSSDSGGPVPTDSRKISSS